MFSDLENYVTEFLLTNFY